MTKTDAEYLKAGRIKLGLDQEQMARALYFQGKHAAQQISRIERGERPLMPDKKALLDNLLGSANQGANRK